MPHDRPADEPGPSRPSGPPGRSPDADGTGPQPAVSDDDAAHGDRADQPGVRPVTTADLGAVRALNAANVPAVGPLDDRRVELFLDRATWLVADRDGIVVATFVGLREGLPYWSPNYRWFADRHDRFAYVDRIAVAPAARGTGLADELYRSWFALAAAAAVPVVCAEVNVVPPNPRSMAFHARHGFVAVGEEAHADGSRVAMLETTVAGADDPASAPIG